MSFLTRIAFLCCSLWMLPVFAAPVIAGKDSGGSYRIVLPANASPAEATAAKELQSFLREITGETLPIAAESAGPAIYVGQSEKIRRAVGLTGWEELKPDEIILKTVGGDLYLTGARPSGSLYAVYELLEKSWGVRFWTEKETRVPRNGSLELPQWDYRYAPPFQVRSVSYDLVDRTDFFAARMRNNGFRAPHTPEWGDFTKILGWCHTFGKMIPAEENFKKHPEWFAMRGKNRVPDAQLCLSNPEVRNELTKRFLKFLSEHPNFKYISCSQNDSYRCCQCPKCTEFCKKHGNQTDLLMLTVNQIADAIAKVRPDVRVMTLAYQYTRTPPKTIMPHDNVVIRFCTIEADKYEPIAPGSRKENAALYADLAAWGKVAKQMAIWNYVVSFGKYYKLHPNWRSLAPDLRLFQRCHAINIFEQAAYNGSFGAAEFADLRAWLLSKLLWDPSLDENKLMNEFIDNYYGPGAKPIRTAIDILCDAARTPGRPREGCNIPDTRSWLKDKTLIQLWEMLAESPAGKAALQDPVYGKRYRTALIPFAADLLERPDIWTKKNAAWLDPRNFEDLARKTEEAMVDAGAVRLREGGGTPQEWLEKLQRPVPPPNSVPRNSPVQTPKK